MVATRRRVIAAAAALLMGVGGVSGQIDPIPEGWLVLSDQLGFYADPVAGPFWGGVWVVDPDVDTGPEAPTHGADSLTAFPANWGLAVLSRHEVVVADGSADPAGLGLDGNPEMDSGPGAVWLADTGTGDVRLLSDGTLFDPALTPPMPTVFASLRDVLVLQDGDLLVVDADADPSGLGPDPGRPFLLDPFGSPDPVLPHVGYGAVLRVDLETGEVGLVADGTNWAGAFPDIDRDGTPEASIFLDPWALADDPTDADAVYLVDTLADPLGLDRVGALFRVRLSTGEVEAVSSHPDYYYLSDLAWKEPEGGVLLLDSWPALGDPNEGGALFLVEPDGTRSLWADPPPFAFAMGLIVDDQDSVFVVDFDADPFGIGAFGAVWLVPDADRDNPLPVSSNMGFFAILSGDHVSRGGWPQADSVSVAGICCEVETQVEILGSGFDPAVLVRGGARLEVRSFSRADPTRIQATLQAACAGAPEERLLRVVNPGGRTDSVPVSVGPAGAVSGLRVVQREPFLLGWDPWSPGDPGVTYDVIRGVLSDLHASGNVGGALCLSQDLAFNAVGDATDPPDEDGFYYLARVRGPCPGEYGPPPLVPARTTTVCD